MVCICRPINTDWRAVVALVERDDYASCASGNSAKLIHGGFRYVERFMVQLVNELCTERDMLHRLNPNLVGRAAFLLPQYKCDKCAHAMCMRAC